MLRNTTQCKGNWDQATRIGNVIALFLSNLLVPYFQDENKHAHVSSQAKLAPRIDSSYHLH